MLARKSEVQDMVEVDNTRYVPRESNRIKCFKLIGCCSKSANEFNTTEEQEQGVGDAMELNFFSRPEDQDKVTFLISFC